MTSPVEGTPSRIGRQNHQSIGRRTVIEGAVWGAPVIAAVIAAPAAAASARPQAPPQARSEFGPITMTPNSEGYLPAGPGVQPTIWWDRTQEWNGTTGMSSWGRIKNTGTETIPAGTLVWAVKLSTSPANLSTRASPFSQLRLPDPLPAEWQLLAGLENDVEGQDVDAIEYVHLLQYEAPLAPGATTPRLQLVAVPTDPPPRPESYGDRLDPSRKYFNYEQGFSARVGTASAVQAFTDAGSTGVTKSKSWGVAIPAPGSGA